MTEVPSPGAADPGRDRQAAWIAAMALSALVLAVYGQVVGFGFVNLDDQSYVYENPAVMRGLGWEGLRWAFGAVHVSNWHPLTWLSHMADVSLFGLDPRWHHLVNLLLHLANTLLLFAVLRESTGATWRSAIVAALFGVHPLHVESVAWIAERKDVLSTLFWLLAWWAYLGYARAPGLGRYLTVAGLFVLGLLSKPMVVTLPFTLLLLDWWPLGRTADAGKPVDTGRVLHLAWEKVPLLLLSAASAAITWLSQSGSGAAVRLEHVPFGARLSNALVSYVAYLADTLWPARLAAFYPHPALVGGGTPAWEFAGAAAVLAAISVLAFARGRRFPFLAWGWLWYLGTLVPVIGLVQVGVQARADRYTYVPLVGIFVAVVWLAGEVAGASQVRRRVAGALAGAAVLALATAAWAQAGTWRDPISLHRHALAVTDRNWQAWLGLGDAYLADGRIAEAIAANEEALRILPGLGQAWNGIGVAMAQAGRPDEAIPRFERAVQLEPGYADAWYNLGTAHGVLGRHAEAAVCFEEAVRLRPEHLRAWGNLAIASATVGNRARALEALLQLDRLDPAQAERLRQQLRLRP